MAINTGKTVSNILDSCDIRNGRQDIYHNVSALSELELTDF